MLLMAVWYRVGPGAKEGGYWEKEKSEVMKGKSEAGEKMTEENKNDRKLTMEFKKLKYGKSNSV